MIDILSASRRATGGAIAALLLFAGTTAAMAQDTRWRVISTFGQAVGEVAAFCPQTTSGGQPSTCFGFVCPANNSMGWAVIAPDASLGTNFRGSVTIDGRSYGTLEFSQNRERQGRFLYYARFDSTAHAALMAAVRAGNRLDMTLATASGTRTFPQVSLAGSMAALDTIAPACRL